MVLRHLPDKSFPPYKYLPGRTPHPRKHPYGQGCVAEECAGPPLTEANWLTNEAYLYGVDLYNHGYWWEAHECWEAAWYTTKDEAICHLLQGLIQLAAAWLKWEDGNQRGRRGLWRRSRDHLSAAATAQSSLAGLDVVCVVDAMDRLFAQDAVRPASAVTPDLPRLCLSPD